MNELRSTFYRAIAMFAKAPRAGLVKTRLTPPLSQAQAARLAQAFVADSSRNFVEAAITSSALAFCVHTPHDASAAFAELIPPQMLLQPQSDGTLSDRLANAYLMLAAQGFTHVCFVGADSPTLPASYVRRAFDCLDAGDDIAIGPATDGGYYLLALRAAHLGVFTDIAWSTSAVFAQTCARAAALGLTASVLPEWFDVDDAPSLRQLCRELGDDASPAREQAANTYRLLAQWRESPR